MSDLNAKEQAPRPEELEREARRLARGRHLTVVREEAPAATVAVLAPRSDRDPGPKTAA